MPVPKIVLAAVLGGVAMFIWGAVTHTLLPLYGGAMSKFADEEAVTQAIAANAATSGTYFLPYEPSGASEEQKKALEERAQRGPQVFAFIRIGEFGSFPAKLLVELVSNIAAVFLLAWMGVKFGVAKLGSRVGAAAAVGLIVVFSTTTSEWNWYSAGFGYLCAETVDQVGGWIVAALGMARFLPKPQAA